MKEVKKMTAKVWKAREVICKIDEASNVTIATTGPIDDDFGGTSTAISGYMKNVTIVEPEGSVEKIDLL